MDDRQLLESQVGNLLRERGLTISAAESCTGGLLMHRLTNIPGSSAYMIGGVVAYDNAIKRTLLNVRPATLESEGAVSEAVAAQMAASVRAEFGTDCALSITGIAGPGGGTPEKPVGLTYIGFADVDGSVRVERHIWQGDRLSVKIQSSDRALSIVIEALTTDNPTTD